jgi:transcriptional regulator with XRE-family HTH domain
LRKRRGLTLSDLATRIGRSVGYVSQVERGSSKLAISDLERIAAALEVQISWFFQGPSAAPPEERDLIVRRANRRRLEFTGSGVVEELLSPTLTGDIELILTTLEPGASTGAAPRARRGEEAGLVLSGILDLELDNRRFRLEAGDSFTLPKNGSHMVHNPGDVPTVVVWVISPPVY